MFLKYDDVRETLGLVLISMTTLTLAPLNLPNNSRILIHAGEESLPPLFFN